MRIILNHTDQFYRKEIENYKNFIIKFISLKKIFK